MTLVESHILSAWCYRALQCDDGSTSHREPLVLRRGIISHSSHQVKEHLLCEECELRIKVAEDYVKPRVATPMTFPLLTELRATASPIPLSGGCAYVADGVDAPKLVNFALGVVWRASVSSTPETSGVALGSYSEPVRRYLLEEKHDAFPENVTVALGVIDQPWNEYHGAVEMPKTTRNAGADRHDFLCLGLSFSIFVGEGAEALPGLTSAPPVIAVGLAAAFGIDAMLDDKLARARFASKTRDRILKHRGVTKGVACVSRRQDRS